MGKSWRQRRVNWVTDFTGRSVTHAHRSHQGTDSKDGDENDVLESRGHTDRTDPRSALASTPDESIPRGAEGLSYHRRGDTLKSLVVSSVRLVLLL